MHTANVVSLLSGALLVCGSVAAKLAGGAGGAWLFGGTSVVSWLLVVVVYRDDLLHPLVILGGIYLFLYCYVPMIAEVMGSPLGLSSYTSSSRASVNWLIAIGFLSLSVGSTAASAMSRRSESPQWRLGGGPGLGLWAARAIVLGGSVLFAYLFVGVAGGGLTNYMDNYFRIQLESYGWYNVLRAVVFPSIHASIVFCIWWCWGRRRRLGVVTLALLVTVVVTALVYRRLAIVLLMMSAIILYHYSVKQVTGHRLLLIAVPLAVLMLFWGIYREATLVTSEVRANYLSVKGGVQFLLSGFNSYDTFIDVHRAFENAVLEYTYGETWLNTLLPLPRTVIEWKPPTTSMYVGRILYGSTVDVNLWRAPSLLPDLFVSFGVVGVVSGMVTVGAIAKWTHSRAIASNRGVLVYSLALPGLFFTLRDELVIGCRWILVTLLVVGMLFLLTSSPRERRSRL